MELIVYVFDFFIHLDRHLAEIIRDFGPWSYLIIFLIIFCETGLVATPVLPGDSLLFGLGYFASLGVLEIEWLFLLLSFAAVAGDTVNYGIGHYVGPRVFYQENARFFKKDYLLRAQRFYERHGGKTIIIARFVPIIRTFAPFVAGIGKMSYRRFISFNVIGGVSWVALMLACGYYFGNIPAVKNNFTLVVIAIIFISILPGVVEYLRQRSEPS
ncbi:MAG: DedA family protein [Syntrophales bacterium LBB04]|nr:DedA family protein [Syntrophales bacterium LBB04]